MKLYAFDIPNSSYEITFDSEEYEKNPDADRFCHTGPFVHWEGADGYKAKLDRIQELEKALRFYADARDFYLTDSQGLYHDSGNDIARKVLNASSKA